MRVLVLVEDYPDNCGNKAMMYVHTRNKYYTENGIDVEVLCFKCKEAYTFEKIRVIPREMYDAKEEYDILIAHAANLKHHYRFIRKYEFLYKKIIFFFHGHEVLKINKVYSKPYEYVKTNKYKVFLQDVYDEFKLLIWRNYFKKINEKTHYIFVSTWMQNEFFKWTKIKPQMISERSSITYNCVGEDFEKGFFDETCEKKYDFVTIRSNLDGSKYAMDLVMKLAKNTPEARFLVVGKGCFFVHNEKPDNVVWLNKTMNHIEIIKMLNLSRYALMPTRTDAQGLMMCEMAAFGIPVITSDIPVCHEIFDGFSNSFFISNDDSNLSLDYYLKSEAVCVKDTRFYMSKTVGNEIDIITKVRDKA